MRFLAGAMAVPQLIGVVLQINFLVKSHSGNGVGPGIFISGIGGVVLGLFALFIGRLREKEQRDFELRLQQQHGDGSG